MGHEIVYCSVCRQQIRASDFDGGKAFRLENRQFCLTCGPDVLRTLPKDKVQSIFRTLSTPTKSPPEPAPFRPSTARTLPPRRSAPPWAVPAGVAAAVVVALLAWLLLGRSPAPPPAPVARTSTPPAPPPPKQPGPEPAPAPPATNPGKEQMARDAVQKARAWAAANPSDFDGAIRQFQDASFT